MLRILVAALAAALFAAGPLAAVGQEAPHMPIPPAKPATPAPPAKPATATPPAKPATPNAKPAAKAATKPAPGHAAAHSPPHQAVTHPTHVPAAPSTGPLSAPSAAPPVAAPAEHTAAAPAEPPKGISTGLPLPRFAALKTDEVNLRSGPGLRYPIEWVYKRRDLPVQIEREFEVWRQVSDQEGVKGWVHQATLVGRRSFVVTGHEQTMRSDPQTNANPVARLKPGVIGRLRSCEAKADWCQVQVGDYRGWLKRDEFWGSYPGEAIQ